MKLPSMTVAALVVSLAWMTLLATPFFASVHFSAAAFEPVPPSGRFKLQHRQHQHRPELSLLTNHDRRGHRFRLSASNISSEEVRRRNLEQLGQLRTRDRGSRKISPSELKIIYEDEHIVCVDKPAGVLCVPSEEGIPTLAQTVFETVPNNQGSLDRMVVHRLGMDTSGIVVFAKTMESLRGMNTLFRTRKITRQYEALVCGHVANDKGTIDLPLMRDYVRPPFMRVSTDEHQRVLLDLDDAIVGKKLLEAPKASKTEYEVIARESFLDTDLPVTRLLLTSVTGRTHQLNVHMAAIGHPIVGDRVYGVDGDAVPNGGLELWQVEYIGGGGGGGDSSGEGPNTIASKELERAIGARAVSMCVHAKCLTFRHPMLPPDDDPLYFECETPF
mmetsp:Transcript_33450/g.78888  ORF Transcript_33450/g.78888 Transcript_33450/m.78888 type:complete len:388 (-) Transcript_33450:949-2112(-)